MKRFFLRWDFGSKKTSRPRIGDMEVVDAKTFDQLLSSLETLLSWSERQVCWHEETHRGGAIWEICNSCGAKWADDEGGRPELSEPYQIIQARKTIAKARGHL